jgi:hypothetical protein
MWHEWEGREKCTKFWWESPKERDHSEELGVDGRMGSYEIDCDCVEWVRLAQDRDRWRAVVSAVINVRVVSPRI